jgi:hypothetical protein
VKRPTNDTEDFVLHLGNGDGHGPDPELELFFAAGNNTLRLQKWGSTLEKEIVGPGVSLNEWHHITLTYDRTATNVGTFALYVDGFAYGTVASVAMNVLQTASLQIGGCNSTTVSWDRWFNGKIEDAMLQSGINGRSEIWGLAHSSARHYNGLAVATTVNITVTGTNQPPGITAIPDVYLPVSAAATPVAFTLSDADNEARTVTVTAASSNTALLPVPNITLSAAPPAWTSSDIGAVGAAGSLTEDSGTFIIGGAGGAIFGTATGASFITAGVALDLNGQQGINEVLTIRGTGIGSAGGLVNNSTTAASIGNGVSSISTTAGGTHSTVPRVTISGDATAIAALGVTAASFTINGGTTVYSAAPTVTISGGGGANAAATAVLTGGVVSGITTTNAGTGYTTAPTIAFSAGTITTAGTNPTGTGNATNFTVNGITVTNTGSGYTNVPTVTFSSGTGTTATANLSTVILGAATTIGGSGDITINTSITGDFALTKAGSGILTLNGASSNPSTTTVTTGTLRGAGTFAGSLAINGGTHAPGNSPGLMTTGASYTLAAPATLQIEINGTTPGTQHDQVSVAGTVTLAGNLDLIAAPSLATGSTFTLINNTGASPISGTFAGKPQNTEFYEDAQWWRLSYTGGTGNDVVLTRISPSAWQTWQATTFGANVNNPAISGDTADSDGDGIGNRLEYATATDPGTNNTTPASATKTEVSIDFIYTKNKAATDVTYAVEWSDDLTAWSSAGVTTSVLTNGATTQQIKALVPAGSGVMRRFVRLKVMRP